MIVLVLVFLLVIVLLKDTKVSGTVLFPISLQL